MAASGANHAPGQPGPARGGQFGANRPPWDYGEGYWGDLDYPGTDLEATARPGLWEEQPYRRGYWLGHANAPPMPGGPGQFAGQGAYGDQADWGPGPDAGVPAEARFPHPAHPLSHPNPPPSFHGVGSRHYRRSAGRIREDVHERFVEDPFLDPRDVDVQVQDGIVTLTGHVPSREMKRRAAGLAALVPGVEDVRNEIRIA
jgi:hypothetical protein